MTPTKVASQKTMEFVICIAHRLHNNPHYDSALLANSLFLVDYMSYFETGKPISDFSYVKQEHGIAPSQDQFIQIKDALMKENELEKTGDLMIKRDANFDLFSTGEKELIEEVLRKISTQSSEISTYTKSLLAWNFAEYNEEIPFYTFQYVRNEGTPRDTELAKNTIKEYLKGK